MCQFSDAAEKSKCLPAFLLGLDGQDRVEGNVEGDEKERAGRELEGCFVNVG